MKFVLAALCAFLPIAANATYLTGTWIGPGQCFLDQFGTNPCQVTLEIEQVENKINVQHCSRDTGSVVDACFIDSYTIQNESELWLNSPVLGGLVKVGFISENSISVKTVYPGQTNEDSFTVVNGSLAYSSIYTQDGAIIFREEGALTKQ